MKDDLYIVSIRLVGDQSRTHRVVAWIIDEPPGWVQLILPDTVMFFPTSQVISVTVPNLTEEIVEGRHAPENGERQ